MKANSEGMEICVQLFFSWFPGLVLVERGFANRMVSIVHGPVQDLVLIEICGVNIEQKPFSLRKPNDFANELIMYGNALGW